MACNPEVLKHVPLFALLDEDETAVLAGQVELKNFAPRQRIYKMGDPGGQAYVMVSGRVRVTTVDEDQQEVVVDEPAHGEFFGFASMLEQTPHQTNATAVEETVCLEVSRGDIATLLQSGGVELLAVKTLMALRELESVIRWGLSDMQRYEKLSDALIVPNLDQDISFFYDPATKKLRKRFEIYPQALEATVKFAHDLERTKTELVKQIQTERQRNL